MSRERWMALAFAVGSVCFLVGPFPGYANLVGARADAATFFVGSIFFTLGGGLQTALAFARRHEAGAGRAAWWTATVQSAGTVFFNVSTFQALDGRTRWARCASSSRARSPTAPLGGAAGCRRAAQTAGGSPR
jgi:hypothetical protein